MEIVSEPEIQSPEEAMAYLRALRELVRYLKVSDGNMEEGSLRCDANVSVKQETQEGFGTKTELKNMNSIRFVGKALAYEIARQTQILQSGGRIEQESRLWNEKLEKTFPMRSKEEAHDYRYFPEPDILQISIDRVQTETLPELPWDKRARFRSTYSLSEEEAVILTEHPSLADFYESLVDAYPNPKGAASWTIVELLKAFRPRMNRLDFDPPLTPGRVAQVLSMVEDGKINQATAKDLLAKLLEEDFDPNAYVSRLGLEQVSDTDTLSRWIEELIEHYPNQVKEYLEGKEKVFGFFVGQLMRLSKGKANPRLLNNLLKERLDALKRES
jgi:aspartyl-tRNA(Asn)/glutamyl-tRNA(Gln) amidotransferase subunit B